MLLYASRMSYALAFVLLPANFKSLQAELDRTLEPFRRGGPDQLPTTRLVFKDVTSDLARLHSASLVLVRDDQPGLRLSGLSGDLRWLLDSCALEKVALGGCVTGRWSGSIAELEPDFDRFVEQFAVEGWDDRAGSYGYWHNPIGKWDWWELGGRFDGVVTGRRRAARDMSAINSGPSAGRDVLTALGDRLHQALGSVPPDEQAEVEANVELVETVLDRLRYEPDAQFPVAIVRPVGSVEEPLRWLENVPWRDPPRAARRALGLAEDAGHAATVMCALERHPGHVVAGVAYHL